MRYNHNNEYWGRGGPYTVVTSYKSARKIQPMIHELLNLTSDGMFNHDYDEKTAEIIWRFSKQEDATWFALKHSG